MFRSILFPCRIQVSAYSGEQLKCKLASLRRGGDEPADFVADRIYKINVPQLIRKLFSNTCAKKNLFQTRGHLK
jgi:hypothetical protein